MSAFALFVLVAPLPAAFVELTPVADASLFEKEPDFNSGQSSLVAGRNRAIDTARARALMKFDLAAAIPSGAHITRATLTIEVVKTPAGGAEPSTFALRRMLRDWGEGVQSGTGGGAPAEPNEATWNSRFHGGELWAAPGGSNGFDVVDMNSSTVPVGLSGSYTFPSTANLVADVQAWLNSSATNFGWMLRSLDEASFGTARRFGSREYIPASSRPTLVVEYVTTPTILAIEQTDAGTRLTMRFPSNQSHRIEYRPVLANNEWFLLTNFPPQTSNSIQSFIDATAVTQRIYRAVAP